MDIADRRPQSANALAKIRFCVTSIIFFCCVAFIINVLINPEVNWSVWVAT